MGETPADAPTGAAVDRARTDLLGTDRKELARLLAPYVERSFRTEQVFLGVYEGGATALGEITTLSKALRSTLEERFQVGLPRVQAREQAEDGTEKLLLTLGDGAAVEAVSIPEPRRRTLCLSSQAGCALACRFCVTGYWGAGRNLTAGEIVGQVLALERSLRTSAPLNLVFMGMGEPLLNAQAVQAAMRLLSEWISWRRMTLSTVGILPALEEMIDWPRRPNLAISLHAPDSLRRGQLMPIEERYPLDELMALLARFPLEPGRRLTFEYVLIRGFNDAPSDASALARLLRGLRAKVNLIPLNEDPVLGDDMRSPPAEAVKEFQKALNGHGVTATVRRQRGRGVAGACGQLRAFNRQARGFPGAPPGDQGRGPGAAR